MGAIDSRPDRNFSSEGESECATVGSGAETNLSAGRLQNRCSVVHANAAAGPKEARTNGPP